MLPIPDRADTDAKPGDLTTDARETAYRFQGVRNPGMIPIGLLFAPLEQTVERDTQQIVLGLVRKDDDRSTGRHLAWEALQPLPRLSRAA